MIAYQAIPFLFLSLAFPALWFKAHRIIFVQNIWLFALLFACMSGLTIGVLETVGIASVILLGITTWVAGSGQFPYLLRIFAGALFLVLAVALGMHLMPGFNNPPVFENVVLSPGAQFYSLYMNFDKALVGLFILALWYQRPVAVLPWFSSGKWLVFITVATISIVMFLALAFGYVRFDPKWINGMSFWIWANLFITCITEEAFFRGLVQHQLARRLTDIKAGKWIAVMIAAALFGLAHFGGGCIYVLLATLAGVGYGAAYAITGRIEASILCHFGLNFMHIVFFTYPVLAKV